MARKARKGSHQGQRLTLDQRLLVRTALVATLLTVIGAVTVVGALLLKSGGGDGGTSSGSRTAIIVDQLELTAPNPDFISKTRTLLSQSGYSVDYVAGSDVTVDTYRTLPSRGYDLVILRVHAGLTTEVDAATGVRTGKEYVSLFTGEPYDETRYPAEQLNRLGKARYTEGADPLFGIGPKFVSDSMEGDFDGALVVMMGCDGLRSQTTAEAFLDRGASAFVSWSKPVSGTHTDQATETLLRYLLTEGMEVEEAVQRTADEIGPDPSYEGELRVLTG